MPVQIAERSELSRTEIAFEEMSIICGICGPGIDTSIRIGICKETLRDEVVGISSTNFVVDNLTGNARHTSSGFKMNCHG